MGITQNEALQSDVKGTDDEEKDSEKKESEESVEAPNSTDDKEDDKANPLTIYKRPRDDVDDETAATNTADQKASEMKEVAVYDAINQNAMGRSGRDFEDEKTTEKEVNNKAPASLSASSSYIGETEDNLWWNHVPYENWKVPKPSAKNKMKRDAANHKIYDPEQEDEKTAEQGLLGKMSTFRYQNA